MAKKKKSDRLALLKNELQRVDGATPGTGKAIDKHRKMTRSPFQFYRGSAQLFYADLASGLLSLPSDFYQPPLTRIMGDCHFANFGFFTEEGSHSDAVIFSPNDFDDACEGSAAFDLLRFIASLHLVRDYLDGVITGRYESEVLENPNKFSALTDTGTHKACRRFLRAWGKTLDTIAANSERRERAVEAFEKKHFLEDHLTKARQRASGGKTFLRKSTVGKLAEINEKKISFKSSHPKLAPLSSDAKADVIKTLRPYMDDTILDVALRLGAGTGSLNVERFYLLVGPSGPITEADLPLVHVVEVKQQRQAAMIAHFPELSPVNRLEAAHLTVDCQRRMMRRPDLILDDLSWNGAPWLIRSRHHARYGLDPEDLLLSDNPDKALSQYAEACGKALALAHARGDRRSTRFEKAMVKASSAHQDALLSVGEAYAGQVIVDHGLLQKALD